MTFKKGQKFSQEEIQKRINTHNDNAKKRGYYHSEETKKKIGQSNSISLKGRKLSNETKYKMSLSKQGHIGVVHTEETKEKIRISTFNYIKKVNNIICPRIGHNEKQLLDKLEKELNYKIIRQYQVKGYFIDGYIPELNLAIEVDERPKNRDNDIIRQNIIEKELNCKFLRINDYD